MLFFAKTNLRNSIIRNKIYNVIPELLPKNLKTNSLLDFSLGVEPEIKAF